MGTIQEAVSCGCSWLTTGDGKPALCHAERSQEPFGQRWSLDSIEVTVKEATVMPPMSEDEAVAANRRTVIPGPKGLCHRRGHVVREGKERGIRK